MRRTVLIAVLSLATTTVVYGQMAEVPSATTLPRSAAEPSAVGPGEPTIAEPPEAVATPGARRVRRSAPGIAEEPVPQVPSPTAPPAMLPAGRAVGFTTVVPRREIRETYRITLVDPEKGVRYGPFPLKNGTPVMVGDVSYVLEVEMHADAVEIGMVPGEQIRKSPEQLTLENKLRKTLIPELSLENATIMAAADLLSAQGDVNIVVTEVVQKSDFSITLRLRNIPLYDAIRYVAEVADIGFRVDDRAVVITDKMPPPVMMPIGGIGR